MSKKFKLQSTAYCGYLHSDGHCVIIHEGKHPQAGKVQWVEIIEQLDLHCDFDGRIVFHNCLHDHRFAMLLDGSVDSIRCTVPSTTFGSENTKRLGIAIGYLEFTSRKWNGSLGWHTMPGVISDGITYQPENGEIFANRTDDMFWSGHRISKIHRADMAVAA